MDFFLNVNWPLWALGTLLCGLPLGAALHCRARKRAARERRRIPARWPLTGRVIANSEEIKVWRWLFSTFFDHAVLIKMPVIRFLLATTPDQRLHCYELLKGVYCTFTVVSLSGQVVGCIDVASRSRQNSTNRKLKQTLLDQCGIPYLALDPDDLPSLSAIRARFVDASTPGMAVDPAQEAAINKASRNLRSSLTRKRRTRGSDRASPSIHGADDKPSEGRGDEASQFIGSRWNENSFLSPLDSRVAALC